MTLLYYRHLYLRTHKVNVLHSLLFNVPEKHKRYKLASISYSLLDNDLREKLLNLKGGGDAQRKEGKRLRSISRKESSWVEQTERGREEREEGGREGCWKRPEDRLQRGDTKKAGNHEGRFPKQSSSLTYWTSLESGGGFTVGCRCDLDWKVATRYWHTAGL